eukprot:jgi/Chrzof1/8589/Cz03g16170.t1
MERVARVVACADPEYANGAAIHGSPKKPKAGSSNCSRSRFLNPMTIMLSLLLTAAALCVMLSLHASSRQGQQNIMLNSNTQSSAAAAVAAVAAVAMPCPASSSEGPMPARQPPFIFPKLIHQTVKNKTHMTCQQQESVQSWKAQNPGYEHTLYDDADIEAFVDRYYPDLMTLFKGLPSNVQRADFWRYLVLHRLGGVYADADVLCMQPIDVWNAQNNHDAEILVGVESVDEHKMVKGYQQFVMAAMPCHPITGSMPFRVLSSIARQYMKGETATQGGNMDAKILGTTGPGVWTEAVEDYARKMGAHLPLDDKVLNVEGGVLIGTLRVLPGFMLSAGWETQEKHISCADMFKQNPNALICHQFLGTWKAKFKYKKAPQYDNCNM